LKKAVEDSPASREQWAEDLVAELANLESNSFSKDYVEGDGTVAVLGGLLGEESVHPEFEVRPVDVLQRGRANQDAPRQLGSGAVNGQVVELWMAVLAVRVYCSTGLSRGDSSDSDSLSSGSMAESKAGEERKAERKEKARKYRQ